MKFDTGKFDEGVFPRRRPWFVLLLVAAIAAFPVYRLGMLVYHRFSPHAGKEPPSSDHAAVERNVRDDGPLSVRKSASASAPVARTPAASVKSAATAVATTDAGPLPAAAASLPGQAVPVPALAPEQFREVLRRGQALEDRGELLEAGQAYAEVLNSCRDARQRSVLEECLGRANIGLLLSRQKMPGKVAYVVKPNDAVEKIARKFGTTKELIAGCNRLGPGNIIQVGQTLWAFTGKFSIAVSRQKHEMVLEMDGAFFKRYGVCIGSDNKTPVGSFVVTEREVNPTWWPAGQGPIPAGDERNLLGTRWLAMKDKQNPKEDRRGLGIHGTKDASSIGKSVSAGCIRMLNSDVEELHMLVPVGTPVTVVD